LQLELSDFDLKVPNLTEVDNFIGDLQNKINTYQSKKDELKTIIHNIETLDNDVENNKKILLQKGEELTKLKRELSEQKEDLDVKLSSRNKLLPLDITPDTKRQELKIALEFASNLFDKSSKALQDLEKTLEVKKSTRENVLAQIEEYKVEVEKLEKELSDAIFKSNFDSREEVEKSILSKELSKSYSDIREIINTKNIEINTKNESISKEEKTLISNKTFEISEDEATEIYTRLKLQDDALIERKGDINQQIKKDNEIRERNKKVFEEIDAQDAVLKKWNTLHAILGGSKDAFNTYVQRLTLESLIALANQHLYKLNKRYSLEINKTFKAGEELNFSLVDHYQTDRLRPVDTTSGGEKFLISLALALGLSDLASNNVSIDSLFIDEGFGTLDPNMLETVISTLETLQSQGKMIGVISHVENLKERISTQIQIHKNSNGVSRVEIV